jgi:alkyl hydroperoxide reductase subunit AhpF
MRSAPAAGGALRFSIYTLMRQALGGSAWPEQWRSPEPRSAYDVVIVGAGGHGLATAYYLAKEHGIRWQYRTQHHDHPVQLPVGRERRTL